MEPWAEGERKPPFPLDAVQQRVVGVLVEKAFCTPNGYPLTLNAAVVGCNQKSAREPVTTFTDEQVEDALERLRQQGLVDRLLPADARTEKYRQRLKEIWGLDGSQRAVLAELLLRGPQSEGDLRGRASRMVEVPTLEKLADVLAQLAVGGFVRRLSPEGQRRGVVWMHLLYPPGELEAHERRGRAMADAAGAAGAAPPTPAPSRPVAAAVSPAGGGEVAALREELRELAATVARLEEDVRRLQDQVSG